MASKRKKAIFAAVALLLSLVATAGLAEGLLRALDPIGLNYDREFQRYKNEAVVYAWSQQPPSQIDLDGRLFWHKPDLELDLGSFKMRTNALGFRGPAATAQKPADRFRILVLGDSVAFGWGVDEEHTFLRRFESDWNATHERKIEVLNAGHLVYDSVQQQALLRDQGLSLSPDLVLLVYVVNDIEPSRDLVEEALLGKAPDPQEAVPDAGDLWTSLAAAARAVSLSALGELFVLQSDPMARFQRAAGADVVYAPEKFGKGPRGWPRSQRALLQMRDLCQERSIPFVVLDHTRPQLLPLQPFCAANGIPCGDLRFADKELELPMYNSSKDTHANRLGHDLLLRKLQTAAAAMPLPR